MKTNFSKEEINLIKEAFNKFIEEYKLKKDDFVKETESKISAKVKEEVLSHLDLSKILPYIEYDGNNVIIYDENHNNVDEYDYDDKGNLIEIKRPFSRFRYIYNDHNQLIEKDIIDNTDKILKHVKYEYDNKICIRRLTDTSDERTKVYTLDNELKLCILEIHQVKYTKYKFANPICSIKYKNCTLQCSDECDDLSEFLENATFSIDDDNVKYIKINNAIHYNVTIDKSEYHKDIFGSSNNKNIFGSSNTIKYYDKEQNLMYCVSRNGSYRNTYFVELYHKNFKNTFVTSISNTCR